MAVQTLIRRLLAPLLALCCGAAAADPGYYVVTVYDNPGVVTADFRYWTVKFADTPELIWPEAGIGWNVNGRWYTELLASWIGASTMATQLSSWNWQNDVLLTQGQYPFDLAIHALWSKSQGPDSGHTLELGPVFQTDIGRTQLNLNLFAEHRFGLPAAKPTQLKYQWQLRHRWQPGLHFGAQGFGEPGPWNHWSDHDRQSHRAGPALFGDLHTDTGTIGWQAAYLFGKVYGMPAQMFSARLHYDF